MYRAENPERDRVARKERRKEGWKKGDEKKKRNVSLPTDTRGLRRINHFGFLLSRARDLSPRFKHSADASGPLLSTIRYVRGREGASAHHHCRVHAVSVRYPFPEYFAPSTRAPGGVIRYPPPMYSVCTEVLSQRLGQHGIARLPRRYAL